MKVEDLEQMIALTREIKKKERDKDVFSKHSYLDTQHGKGDQQHKKAAWEKKIKFSGTMVMNTGSAQFNGLKTLTQRLKWRSLPKSKTAQGPTPSSRPGTLQSDIY